MNYIKIITSIILIFFSRIDADSQNHLSIIDKFSVLESNTEGRLGVFALNTANDYEIEYRANQVFPTGCTSKVIGVSAVLRKSMSDPTLLLTNVKYSNEELDGWSPITGKNVTTGMTIQDLCAASISYSDNTAMNLLLKTIDGVQGMNVFARSIGDISFRQDNDWPTEAYSGGANNLKDSSTPKSMVESLYKLTLGNALDKPQRDLLISWLIDTKTGVNRIRSAIPKGWIIGNKTGTGALYGSTNDLAIVWPPNHAPILMGIYYTSDIDHAQKREDVVAEATRILVEEFINQDITLNSTSTYE
jgi:beta-lactamase class A